MQTPPLTSREAQAEPRLRWCSPASSLLSTLWFQVGDEYLRKQHRVLADLHYGQAGRLFQLLKDTPCELLRVQLERVAFAEFQMSSESVSLLGVGVGRAGPPRARQTCGLSGIRTGFLFVLVLFPTVSDFG